MFIVNGASGTGKTHLSRRLAQALRLPLFSKDDIKEGLFDELSNQGTLEYDVAWSQKLGGASFDVLFNLIEQQLKAGVPCIIESAFNPKFNTARFQQLKDTYGYHPFQIYCYTDPATLAARVNQRQESGERHPVHHNFFVMGGDVTAEQVQKLAKNGKFGILDIGGDLMEIDTTDFEAIDFTGLVEQIKTVLNGE